MILAVFFPSIFALSHIDLVVSIFHKIYPMQIISNHIKANTFVEYGHLPPRYSANQLASSELPLDSSRPSAAYVIFKFIRYPKVFVHEDVCGLETVVSNCFYAARNASNKPETVGGSEKHTFIHLFMHRYMFVVICVCVCVHLCIHLRARIPATCMLHRE